MSDILYIYVGQKDRGIQGHKHLSHINKSRMSKGHTYINNVRHRDIENKLCYSDIQKVYSLYKKYKCTDLEQLER